MNIYYAIMILYECLYKVVQNKIKNNNILRKGN